VQEVNDCPSRRHSNVEPASFEANLKLADVLAVVAAGPEVIVVCGGVVSVPTVQVAEAGVESVLSDGSVART
jgi:hypothetical protein